MVLVDDLDRSLPDTVVETPEAIKLFLSVKKMAFVFAADEENVASAIGRRLAARGQPMISRRTSAESEDRAPDTGSIQRMGQISSAMTQGRRDDPAQLPRERS